MARLNWLDYAFLLVVALSALEGLRRGLVRSLTGVVGLGLGIVLALRYYRLLGDWMDVYLGWGPPLAAFLERHFGLPGAVPLEVAGGFFDLPAGQATPLMLAGSVLDAIAFVVLVAGTVLAVHLAGRLCLTVGGGVLTPADRLAGFGFGALRGVLIVLVLLVGLRLFALSGMVWGPNFLANSLRGSSLAPAFGALLDLALLFIPGKQG
ncbi:MAG: CvpA family protein [Desulfotomaculales bacterium]